MTREAGKGSKPRKYNKSKFDENYERIYRSKKRVNNSILKQIIHGENYEA